MVALPKPRCSLDGRFFDVVVIGGGITGVAIARECARARRATLLIEQNDFASGTTSRSTRIIHGGLRYLEHGEFSLVRESLRERERLLQTHPHLVRPLEFLLALRPGARRNRIAIRSGLWLYRRMAGGTHLGNPANSAAARRALESQLDAGRRWSVFGYEDAQCEFPERIVAEWVVEASARGAVIRNHTQALKIERLAGRARSLLLRDAITGDEQRVESDWIINASGPWADSIAYRSGIVPPEPLVGGVRGSHIVLPRPDNLPEAGIYCEASDGRPIFLIPWNGQLLIGTTEICDSSDPSRTCPDDTEIDYLIQSANAVLPGLSANRRRIVYAFAGIRPLPFSPGSSPSGVTRRHILHDHAAEGAMGMISVIGGKLTTAAAIARDVARSIGIRVIEPAISIEPGPSEEEIEHAINLCARQVAQLGHLSKTAARILTERYGGETALVIARLARGSEALRAPLCNHTQHIAAEAVYSINEEYAVTLGDILLRRVPVALGACWSAECTRHAAQRVGKCCGWNSARIELEIEYAELERTKFLVRPSAHPSESRVTAAA